MELNIKEEGITTEAWLYLIAGQKVTKELPELLFWILVDKKVLSVQVEKSPVKSEGEILYVKPGAKFNALLSPLEEMFRMPFQTRMATRLKWKNYVPQVLRIIKNPRETEKNYILPELKAKGLLKSSWFDQLLGRKTPVSLPEEYGIVFENRIKVGRAHKALYEVYLVDNEWDM